MPTDTEQQAPTVGSVPTPHATMRRSIPKDWKAAEVYPLGNGQGELKSSVVKNIQQKIYRYDKDFGNRGKQEKFDTLLEMLSSENPERYENIDEDSRNSFIKSLLTHMGEMDTYSAGEFIYDTVVPGVGAVTGAVLGGEAGSAAPVVGTTAGAFTGSILGSSVAAGIGEVLKMNYERYKRGIPLMTVDEIVDAGLPVAVAEMIFSLGVPLLARMKLGAQRMMLLPGSPLKGGVKQVPGSILEAQAIIGEHKVKPTGIYSFLTDRIRYGPGGARASLSVQQLNDGQENFISTLAELTGDSFVGKGVTRRRWQETFEASNQAALDLMENIGDQKGWGEVGKIINHAVAGKLKLVKATNEALWADARRELKQSRIGVPTTSLTDFFIEKYEKKYLKQDMQKLEGFIIDTLSTPQQPLTSIPSAIDATDALDLWNSLNAIRSNPRYGKQAGHLAGKIQKDLFNRVEQVSGSDGDAYLALTRARKSHIAYKERFENDVITQMLNRMKREPEAIESFIYGGGLTRASKLKMFKAAMPRADYEQRVLPVLRYAFMDGATSVIRGVRPGADKLKVFDPTIVKRRLDQFGAQFDSNGRLVSAGDYLGEIYGGTEGVKQLIRNMDAIEAAMQGTGGTKILMRMLEATVAMGAAQEVAKSGLQRGVVEAAPGVVSFIVSPFLLSSGFFTNRRLARELTSGMVGHKPVEHAVMTITRMIEQANRDWTQEQVIMLNKYFKSKMEEFGEELQQPPTQMQARPPHTL